MNIKVLLFLCGVVIFGYLAVKQILFSDPEEYISQIKDRVTYRQFIVESLDCETNSRTSDVTWVKVKGVSQPVKGYWNCSEEIINAIKESRVIEAHIDPQSNEMLSLFIQQREVVSYDSTLKYTASNYDKYHVVYLVMFVFFLAVFLKELLSKK